MVFSRHFLLRPLASPPRRETKAGGKQPSLLPLAWLVNCKRLPLCQVTNSVSLLHHYSASGSQLLVVVVVVVGGSRDATAFYFPSKHDG